MKGSVRVTHPTKRNALEVVVDFTRPLESPALCPTCRVVHTHKAYHILLNDLGAAVVSEGVFAGLRRAKMGDLVVESQVKNPPNQVLGTSKGMMGLVPSRDKIVHYHE